ncbi:hypothetical protein [Iningainema tapete]|nr:hypothetical protein [Iningainema tapete]
MIAWVAIATLLPLVSLGCLGRRGNGSSILNWNLIFLPFLREY